MLLLFVGGLARSETIVLYLRLPITVLTATIALGTPLGSQTLPPSLPPASPLPPVPLPPIYSVVPVSPPPLAGPTFEEASPFPPCAFCPKGLDPSQNPADDLLRYEEMNPEMSPETERLPRWEGVPMGTVD
jgi:hypothetical protein